MFQAAGQVMVVVDDVKLAEPRFSKLDDAFDVCLHLVSKDDPGQADWWHGEVSQDYGTGNYATTTRAESTGKTLASVGFEGSDLSTLKDQMIGKEFPAMIKAAPQQDGKVFYNVQYIGSGGNDPIEIDAATMQKRLASQFGNAAPATAAPAPAPMPAAQPAAVAQPAAQPVAQPAAQPAANPFPAEPAAAAPAGSQAASNPFSPKA